MAEIIFITGGQRSGKSNFAKQLAESKSNTPVFLATARVWDDDFKKRIERHKNDRGPNWKTIEEQIYLGNHNLASQTVVLDCVTLWLTNIFSLKNYNPDDSLQVAKKEWKKFVNKDFTLLVVSNEIGMGVHPENESARKFADLQGWMNQYIAKSARQVYLMVSGLPIQIK